MARILIGDIKGDRTYLHIRYSANADGTDFTDTPQAGSKYIGIYAGLLATAPTDKTLYQWVQVVIS